MIIKGMTKQELISKLNILEEEIKSMKFIKVLVRDNKLLAEFQDKNGGLVDITVLEASEE